jgi:excisionase family DNA binding protein
VPLLLLLPLLLALLPARLIDVPAAADRLGTTERHVRELIYRREIPYTKVGRLVRFDTDELETWIADRRVPATNGAADVA